MIEQTSKTWKPFKLNDEVWLETKNLKLKYRSKKMQPKRLGPFKVIGIIGSRAYRLELPSQWKIHDVFHISLLSPFRTTDTHGPSFSQPPPDIINGEEEYEVEGIINHRVKRSGTIEYLIKYLSYDENESKWMGEDELGNCQEILDEYKEDNGL